MPSITPTDAFWLFLAIVLYLLIHRFRTGRWL